MLDAIFGGGKLVKMIIQAYKPTVPGNTTRVLSTVKEDQYAVQINPESYSISHNVNYQRSDAMGTSDSAPKLANMSPTSMSFTIIFDGTGVVPPPAGPLDNIPIAGAIADLFSDDDKYDVMKEIAKFSKVVYTFDPASHGPRWVQITWGRQIYDCVMISMALNYKLFDVNGTPLRVEAQVSFQSAIADVLRENKEGKESPDLTHQRTVIAGDTLPLMTHEIYGKPEYYIEVARANKLYDFRKLRKGSDITFPPAKKQ